jgi:hypothetical protein
VKSKPADVKLFFFSKNFNYLFLAVLFDTLRLVEAGQTTIMALIQPPILYHLKKGTTVMLLHCKPVPAPQEKGIQQKPVSCKKYRWMEKKSNKYHY